MVYTQGYEYQDDINEKKPKCKRNERNEVNSLLLGKLRRRRMEETGEHSWTKMIYVTSRTISWWISS